MGLNERTTGQRLRRILEFFDTLPPPPPPRAKVAQPAFWHIALMSFLIMQAL